MIELFICYLLDPTSLWVVLLDWFIIFNGPQSMKNWGIDISPWIRHQSWWISLPDQYRLIDNHRSDPSIRTKLSDFIFYRIVASSSYSTSFFTNGTRLVMCSIWKNRPMSSIYVLYTLVSRWWVTKLSSKNPSYLVLIGRDFHHLVLSDNLNEREADWMHLM
jgi:hypothetical protein